jgi:hypothetical protein
MRNPPAPSPTNSHCRDFPHKCLICCSSWYGCHWNITSELDEEVAKTTAAADKATAAEDPPVVFVESVENVEEMQTTNFQTDS